MSKKRKCVICKKKIPKSRDRRTNTCSPEHQAERRSNLTKGPDGYAAKCHRKYREKKIQAAMDWKRNNPERYLANARRAQRRIKVARRMIKKLGIQL